MTDTDIVSEYCRLAEQGAEFDSPALAALRDRMTDADLIRVEAWLEASAKANFEEAAELRGQAKKSDPAT